MVKFKVVKAADIALAAALVILAAAVVAVLLMTRAQKAQPTLATVTPEPVETSLALDTENEHTDPAVVTSTRSPCCPSATPSARNHRSTATTPRRSTGSSKYILMKEGIVCLPQNAIYCWS